MSFKAWCKLSLSLVIIFFILNGAFNFIINPYNIFHHHLFPNFLVIKKHNVSTRMQIFYRTIYDDPKNIMMGTSRIGMLSPSYVTKYLGGSTRNMAMAGANIEEETQYLLYMIKNHTIQNIVWSLDFFSFNPDLQNDSDFKYDRLESENYLNNDRKIAIMSFQTTNNSFRTLYDNFKATDKAKNDYKKVLNDEDGEYEKYKLYNELNKKEIDKNTAWQITNYPKKFLIVKTFDHPHSINLNLKKVQRVIDACKKKNINLIIYTSPISKDFLQLYKDLNLENTFKYWKKGLAEITAYTDFCDYNIITKNPYNFVDATHIMPKFSELVFARIFNDLSVEGPKDFGKYIAKKVSD